MSQPITQIIHLLLPGHLLWMWKLIGYNDVRCKCIQLQLMVAPNIIIPSHTFVPTFGFGTSHGQRLVLLLHWFEPQLGIFCVELSCSPCE